jgi:hypothetical protein
MIDEISSEHRLPPLNAAIVLLRGGLQIRQSRRRRGSEHAENQKQDDNGDGHAKQPQNDRHFSPPLLQLMIDCNKLRAQSFPARTPPAIVVD